MSRLTAWSVHASTLAVGVTGLVYTWMLLFCSPADEWSVLNHPLQADVQHLHVVTAPLLVFAVGLIWRAHVWLKLRRGHAARRSTGWVLAVGFAPMAVSGYLLQVSADEAWRLTWSWLHLGSSLLWLLAYLGHQWPAVFQVRAPQKLQPAPTSKNSAAS